MNKRDFLTALAPNSEIEYTHFCTKSLLTPYELIWLLGSGFTDCSYGNDEYPSFAISNNSFIKGIDPIVLFFHPLNEKGKAIKNCYSVGIYGTGDFKVFKSIQRAIVYYQQLSSEQIFSVYDNQEGSV